MFGLTEFGMETKAVAHHKEVFSASETKVVGDLAYLRHSDSQGFVKWAEAGDMHFFLCTEAWSSAAQEAFGYWPTVCGLIRAQAIVDPEVYEM
jgi:hypothetical protein